MTIVHDMLLAIEDLIELEDFTLDDYDDYLLRVETIHNRLNDEGMQIRYKMRKFQQVMLAVNGFFDNEWDNFFSVILNMHYFFDNVYKERCNMDNYLSIKRMYQSTLTKSGKPRKNATFKIRKHLLTPTQGGVYFSEKEVVETYREKLKEYKQAIESYLVYRVDDEMHIDLLKRYLKIPEKYDTAIPYPRTLRVFYFDHNEKAFRYNDYHFTDCWEVASGTVWKDAPFNKSNKNDEFWQPYFAEVLPYEYI
jgi:hypothetical protein